MYRCPCVVFYLQKVQNIFFFFFFFSEQHYTLVCFLVSPTPTAIPTVTHRPGETRLEWVCFFFSGDRKHHMNYHEVLEHLVPGNTPAVRRKQTILTISFCASPTLTSSFYLQCPRDVVLQLLKSTCSSLCYNWLDRDYISSEVFMKESKRRTRLEHAPRLFGGPNYRESFLLHSFIPALWLLWFMFIVFILVFIWSI